MQIFADIDIFCRLSISQLMSLSRIFCSNERKPFLQKHGDFPAKHVQIIALCSHLSSTFLCHATHIFSPVPGRLPQRGMVILPKRAGHIHRKCDGRDGQFPNCCIAKKQEIMPIEEFQEMTVNDRHTTRHNSLMPRAWSVLPSSVESA